MRYLAIAAVVTAILVGVIFSTAGKKMMHGSDGMMAEVTLPAPDSAGADLYKQYCGQCHGLPAVDVHTADEWPRTVERMITNIASSGKEMPDEDERRLILIYLTKHAPQ